MVRVGLVLAGLLSLALPAMAQTARPYGFLPADVRPEIRAELEGSAWMRRLSSAAGWVIISDWHAEWNGDKRITPNHCLDELEGPKLDTVYTIRDELREIRILPGNMTENIQRYRMVECDAAYADRLPPSFEKEAATESEITRDHKYDNQRLVYLYPSSLSFNPRSLGPSAGSEKMPYGRVETHTTHLKIKESDPDLKPGAEIRMEIAGSEADFGYRGEAIRAPSTWSFAQTCRIEQWQSIGEGENELPFKAAIGSCDAMEGLSVPGLAQKNVFALVPELDWHFGSMADGKPNYNVRKEASGRWRITMLDGAIPGSRRSWLILSPEAAAAYLPRRN